jgi:hypothetical protein
MRFIYLTLLSLFGLFILWAYPPSFASFAGIVHPSIVDLLFVLYLLAFSILYSIIALRILLAGGKTRAIQAPPAQWIRSIADIPFSRRTYEQVLEPILRDLFDEYCEALNQKRPWKARWVRIRGYWSFWSAVFAQLPISVVKMVYKIWKASR